MHTYSVEEMRELLLEYGATDTRRLRQHFRICQAAVIGGDALQAPLAMYPLGRFA